jgi:hypothetical protein
LTSIHCYFVAKPRAIRPHTPDKERAFKHTDNTFKAAILSVLGDSTVDANVPLQTGKEMWDALEAIYAVFDAGSELYVMEQFHGYRMVDDRSIVEQAHVEIFGYVLPDKFMAGCIIAKLPQAWTNFATSLKHKRQKLALPSSLALCMLKRR